MFQLKILSFSFKKVSVNELSKFFIAEEYRAARLSSLKKSTQVDELVYLATCNRVEFIFSGREHMTEEFLEKFFNSFNPLWSGHDVSFAVRHAAIYEGDLALHHIFSVASSLDSMVIGEREIITQVRKAYDECRQAELTGDFLRLVIRNTILTAKQVYTRTKIATHPVSVVSLAYRRLREIQVKRDAGILMIGAGETNATFLKYLVKHGFRNVTIFNRTEERAVRLAESIKTKGLRISAYPLKSLEGFTGRFDVLISCTASDTPVVTSSLYRKLVEGDAGKKTIVDLAVPADVEEKVTSENNVTLINMNMLKKEAEKNLSERKNELKSAEVILGENIVAFHQVLRQRRMEVAMKDIPGKIHEVKNKLLTDVFVKDIEKMDEQTKKVVNKMLDYMEKKCISIPMIIAKEMVSEDPD